MGTTHKMTAQEAYATLGINAHEHDMRVRFQECFACRAQLNFMRLYVEGRRFCPECDKSTGSRREALDVLNSH